MTAISMGKGFTSSETNGIEEGAALKRAKKRAAEAARF